ncbi:dTDP-glucose 4,6-dehydratase [Candidatus Ornithobacterium hominis]|uniref:dTDP-glucose 4,6-dehydratase n=1 Tax=Candidatus Ornithobacterium hominis TaxID=2497989 RepID=A0A383TX91_9FLAO|nr:SDR family oxidoreductase [Candidatus Ornithobacterium hominis]MCT7904506.1 SDR family oxidoreductase [Candidatus Ornithobacterium hominis]SZD71403.1 dTDP-glucose 4,6-dehydratase [Candidatus Ornithobacterium hominis]
MKKHILVTGAAGFIGSNLVETLLAKGYQVSGLDNFATGHRKNIEAFLVNENFSFTEGDIRDLATCQEACKTVDFILHQAALGSVPRSINDPITSNDVNVGGFLNMLVAARDNGVKRFVYAASSSTYGDSIALPKIEDKIGKPLSPYAVTKLVNEVYADVFYKTYGLNSIGLRYFNVFGRRQDPNGAYAAVIPKFVLQFMQHKSPTINGDGSFSRDFTYIDNVIQMNFRAIETENEAAFNEVYNTAVGDRISIKGMAELLRTYLSEYDAEIANVEILYGPNRKGDVPHSLASIDKAKEKLGYEPTHIFQEGLKEAVAWYWENLR